MVTTILKRRMSDGLSCCEYGGKFITYDVLHGNAIGTFIPVAGHCYDKQVNFCPFCGAKIEYIDGDTNDYK